MKKKHMAVRLGTAGLLAALSLSTPVLAAGSNYGSDIGGTKTTTFDKYLVMDASAEVPNASFTYAVSAGEAKTYDTDGKKFEILAGVDADKVTMAGVGTQTAGTIAYAQGDAVSQEENASVKNYDHTTQKYAAKTATLDFSACRFTEPGVYRYIVTESGVNQGIVNDADLTRVIDVYVEDASDDTGKKLSIAGYVLHSNENDSPDVSMGEDAGSAGSYGNAKSQGFTNVYETSDLIIRKEVTGNQASRDKYFEFTVTISDAVAGTRYPVSLDHADVTSGSNAATITANTGKTNPTELVVGEDGTVTQKFYLQHGQEIRILGLANATTYDVTENAEDYKSTPAGVADYTDAVKGSVDGEDLKTSYLNTRNGVIPTGVVMAVAPFAAVTLFGGFGMVALMMKKRKDDE